MVLQLTTYTHEQRNIKNVTAFDYDGETGVLRYTSSDKPLRTEVMSYIKDVKAGDDDFKTEVYAKSLGGE